MPGFVQNQVAGNYLAGRRNAQDEQYGDVRNQLNQQAVQQNQNEFADRTANIDAGKQKASAERLFLAAQYGLQNPAPKQFIEQNFPEIAQAAGDKWRLSGDEEVKRELQNVIGKYGAQAGVVPAPIEPEKFSAPQEYVGPDGKPGVYQIGGKGTARQVPGISPYEAPKGSGLSVTSPDGTVIQLGGNGTPNYAPTDFSKATRTALEQAFTNSQGNSYALREQIAKYREEFSTLGGRAKAAIAGAKDYVGMENAPQQQQYLTDFTSWKSDTNALLSQYLNQLSGAAISPTEEARLKGGFPNADDGPTVYKAKAEATLRRFALVQARAAYILSSPGLKLDSVSLEGMGNVIAVEANKLAKALEKGGMSADQAQQQAIIKTRQRFGMDN